MVEELQEKAVSSGADKKKRRLQVALVAIFVIVAVAFIGWQLGWF